MLERPKESLAGQNEDPAAEATTDMQKLSKGAKYYEKMRLSLQSHKVLESAWLLFQEMTIKHDVVDQVTLKKLKSLFRQNKLDEAQKKMRIVRPKWLAHDGDASLSLKAMQLYAEIIKTGAKTAEQNLITRHIN
jgi:hypothetical protein